MFNNADIVKSLNKICINQIFFDLSYVNQKCNVIKMRITFFDLKKLAFIMAPILLNTDPDTLNLLGIQWILNVVIAEMNLYEAGYCLHKKKKMR